MRFSELFIGVLRMKFGKINIGQRTCGRQIVADITAYGATHVIHAIHLPRQEDGGLGYVLCYGFTQFYWNSLLSGDTPCSSVCIVVKLL